MFNASKVKSDLVQWIKDFFNCPGHKGSKAVIGISGGADSNITAALCKEALGAKNVFGVLMPNGVQNDIEDAHSLVRHLGITYCELNIEPIVTAFYKVLEDGGFTLNDMVTTNTPARIRSALLFAICAMERGRFCNNGNASEVAIGWRTKGGDTVGDFAPLKNLVKSEVIAVGHETELLARHVDKTPEDGLSGKSDEENFGFTYEELDRFIRTGYINDPATKNRITQMMIRGAHKEVPIKSFPYSPTDTLKKEEHK